VTKRELIQEYVAGRIDRRDFMVRLTGLGVSSAAALAYMQSLTPSVAAAPRDANGYLLQAVNAEYGPGGIFQAILELLKFLSKFFQSIINLLLALLAKLVAAAPASALRMLVDPIAVGDPLPNGDTLTQSDADQLKTLLNQLQEHQSAINSAFKDFGGTVPAADAGTPSKTGDLTTLAEKLNTLVSIQAAVIPTISGEGPKTTALRTTLVSAALVEAEQTAFVNQLVGDPPFPSTFAKAATSDEIEALIKELGA
jgi:hypothetical protein